MATQQQQPVVIEYVGLSPASLSAEARQKLETFVESANRSGGLLGVRVFPNFDAVGEDLPSGVVAIYSPSAKVDASLLSDDLFQIMAVAKVVHPPTEETHGEAAKDVDRYFASKLSAIQGAVSQTPSKDEVFRASICKPISNKELKPWAPQLGGRGAFAGVYSCIRDGDSRQKDYFLVTRATLPEYVNDLKRDLAIKQPTYGDLIYGDRVSFGKTVASRNVYRILSNLGEACQVDILRMNDPLANLPNPDCAPCEMAVPEWEHMSHSIASVEYKGKPAVAVSYGVVPSYECLADEHFFVVANPYDGISRFPLTKHEDVKAAIGLPMDTGRKMAPSQLVGATVAAERLKGVTWENMKTAPQGGGFHEDLHQDAFRPLDKQFKMAMREMGWDPEHHVDRLVPIAIKITSPQ